MTRPPRGVPEAATLELPEPAVELDAVKVVGAEAAATRLTVLSLVDSTLLRCNVANVSAQRASLVQVDGQPSRRDGSSDSAPTASRA